jgi:hypothetical protein
MLGTNSHKKRFLLGGAVILLALFSVFSGCFSPWRGGGEATIILYLGDASGSREVGDFPEFDKIKNVLNYEITLTSEGGEEKKLDVPKGASTVQVSVVPGTWDISVRAYLLYEDLKILLGQDGAGTGNNNENEMLYQWSYAGALVSEKEIKAGPNTVNIKMLPYYYVTINNEREEELQLFVLKDKTVYDGKTIFGTTVVSEVIEALKDRKPPEIPPGLYEGKEMPTFEMGWIYLEDKGEGEGGGAVEPGGEDGGDQGKEFNFDDHHISSNMDIYPKWECPSLITDVSTLNDAITYVTTEGGDYTYLFASNEQIDEPFYISSEITLLNLTLIGIGDEPTIITFPDYSSANDESLFYVYNGASLTLGENITLQGKTDNSAALVKVEYRGTFTMKEGSKITGNTNTDGNGGGVYVGDGGTFNMEGGTISGNKAASGGGVYIFSQEEAATFTMTGGFIEDNTATDDGGGVYVNGMGTFNMTDGYIQQNVAATYGGGVYVYVVHDSSSSEGGGFNKTGGIIYGGDDNVLGNSANGKADASFDVNSPGHAVVVSNGQMCWGKNKTVEENLDSASAATWEKDQ